MILKFDEFINESKSKLDSFFKNFLKTYDNYDIDFEFDEKDVIYHIEKFLKFLFLNYEDIKIYMEEDIDINTSSLNSAIRDIKSILKNEGHLYYFFITIDRNVQIIVAFEYDFQESEGITFMTNSYYIDYNGVNKTSLEKQKVSLMNLKNLKKFLDIANK